MAKSALHKIYEIGIKKGYAEHRDEAYEAACEFIQFVADNPSALEGAKDGLREHEFMHGLFPILENVAAGELEIVEEFKKWFASIYQQEEMVGICLEQWVETKLLPDADRGAKISQGRLEQSKRYSDQRRAEWEKYAPYLDEYFERNPGHCITDGRRACEKEFGRSTSTIKRRTKEYIKPNKS